MKEKNNKPIIITIILTGLAIALISTLPYFLEKKEESDTKAKNKSKLEEQIEGLREVQTKHGYSKREETTEEAIEETTEEISEETTEKSNEKITLSKEELERGYWVDENGLEHEFEQPMKEVEILDIPDSLKDELGEDVFNEVIEKAKETVRVNYQPNSDYESTKYIRIREEDGKKFIMFEVVRDLETYFDVIVNPDNAVWVRTY